MLEMRRSMVEKQSELPTKLGLIYAVTSALAMLGYYALNGESQATALSVQAACEAAGWAKSARRATSVAARATPQRSSAGRGRTFLMIMALAVGSTGARACL